MCIYNNIYSMKFAIYLHFMFFKCCKYFSFLNSTPLLFPSVMALTASALACLSVQQLSLRDWRLNTIHTHPITHQLLKPCFCSRTKCTASLSTVFIVSYLLQQHPNLNRTKSHWSETQCSNQGVKVYLVSMDPECNGCRQQSEGHLSWKTLICGDTAGWFYCDLYLKLPSVIFLRYENANGSVREMMQAQCICYRKRKRRWGGQTGIGQTADCLSFLSVNHACSFLSFSDLL